MKKIHEQEKNLNKEEIDESILNRLLYINDKNLDFANDKEMIDHLATFYVAVSII